MRIVCFSDTHGDHRKVKDMPDGDVLVCAGDVTPNGKLKSIMSFIRWFKIINIKIVFNGLTKINHFFMRKIIFC
jgi:predicted phosphodiesterase